MKFKKLFAVLSSAALSFSMLSAINVSANLPATPSVNEECTLEYTVTSDGAVIAGAYGHDGEPTPVEHITIPEITDKGLPVVGISDLAFYNCNNLKSVTIPDSVMAANIGEAAFLRKSDVEKHLLSVNQGMELNVGLAYAANTVEYMGKTNWKGDEEELEAAKTVLSGIKAKAGYGDKEELTLSLGEATDIIRLVYLSDLRGNIDDYVRPEGVEDTSRMSFKSYENFTSWVKLIPEDLTVMANEGSDAAANAKAKEILGIKFEALKNHLLGDANQDGIVNVRDCAKIANAVAFKTVDQLPCFECADYNEDGTVNVRDAAQLANAIATGKIGK